MDLLRASSVFLRIADKANIWGCEICKHIPASDNSCVNHAQTRITAIYPWCNILLPQKFHWKHCLLYSHTLLRIKKGNWQSTMKKNMSSRYAFQKAMSSDDMYLTQIHFHLYNTSGEQKTLFPIAPLEYRQTLPPSFCVHILSSDWIINNMTSIDAFKNIDKNLYIFASQYYVKKKKAKVIINIVLR